MFIRPNVKNIFPDLKIKKERTRRGTNAAFNLQIPSTDEIIQKVFEKVLVSIPNYYLVSHNNAFGIISLLDFNLICKTIHFKPKIQTYSEFQDCVNYFIKSVCWYHSLNDLVKYINQYIDPNIATIFIEKLKDIDIFTEKLKDIDNVTDPVPVLAFNPQHSWNNAVVLNTTSTTVSNTINTIGWNYNTFFIR